MERVVGEFSGEASAAARADRSAQLRWRRAARQQRGAMMARSTATKPNNDNNENGLIRAPAAGEEEVVSRQQVQQLSYAAPAPPPACRLIFCRQPPQVVPPSPPAPHAPLSPLAQAHPNSPVTEVLDYQIEKADQGQNNNSMLALGSGASNFPYAGQFIFGHPPEFGAAAVSTSSAEGFQAREAKMQNLYFAAERNAPVDANTQAAQPDTGSAAHFGHDEPDSEMTADNFTGLRGASSSYAAAASCLVPHAAPAQTFYGDGTKSRWRRRGAVACSKQTSQKEAR